MISLIAAVSDNNVIGRAGGLPWRQKADWQYFKTVTKGRSVVMGLKTFESIGRALPGRENYVLTHDPSVSIDGVHVISSLEEIPSDENETFIIGGGMVYAQAIETADRLYITEIHTRVDDGDAFFPQIDSARWREISRDHHEKDLDNQFDYDFVVYDAAR